MAETGDDPHSSLPSDGAELSSGDDSASSSGDESADMIDLTTASRSEGLSAQNNVAVFYSASAPEMPARPFPFLNLPPELRMRVYYYLVRLKRRLYFDGYVLGRDIDLRLLQTCRQIYEESRHEVFKYNMFYYRNFTWAYCLDKPLLPDQKSAIRSISVAFDSMFDSDFLNLCTSFCEFVSDFKGLRKAEIPVDGFLNPVCIDDPFHLAEDDWKEGITTLQTLGLVHWDGVMIRPEDGETDVKIQGLLRLRIGHGQDTLGDSQYGGVSGNELRLLFRSHCLLWQSWLKEQQLTKLS